MIDIDISFLDYLTPGALLGNLWLGLKNGGWIILVYYAFQAGKHYWHHYMQHEYEHHRQYILLSILIPKMNEQSPKAVEQIFAQIHGSLSGTNFIETWWHGKTQERFSFEIVSLGGHIQFFVRATAPYRDLIESAFFSQYPDVEIVEVPDYMDQFPKTFPDPDWSLWGGEFAPKKEEAYPLRTYVQFEHALSQELKDPLSGLLEGMSKIGPDENIFVQYVATPVNDDWKEHADHLVKKLSGAPVEHSTPWFQPLLDFPSMLVNFMIELFAPAGEEHSSGGHDKEEPPSLVQYMTPGERAVLEGVQMKLAKIGYRVKIRVIYIAKHHAYNKPRGVVPIKGAFNQFGTQDMNALKHVGSTVSDVDYLKFLIPKRRTKILKAYRQRDAEMGAGPGKVLNIEELATLFHFPVITVKAPMMQKTEAKRAEPPFALPVSEGYRPMRKAAQPSHSGHGAHDSSSAHDAHANGNHESDHDDEDDDLPHNLPVY